MIKSLETSAHFNDEHKPYPTEALPAIIRHAVLNYHEYGQQPLPLIACSALANVSLACQSAANVMRDNLLTSPISLYFLVIAASGERKSAADSAFGKSIRQWEKNIREELLPEVRTAQAKHQAWKITKNALLLKIKNTFKDKDRQMLEKTLIKLVESEPLVPLLPTLFFEDATQEALTEHLAHGWPSASLWSDEGGIVLSSQGLKANTTKFVTTLNGLWDGKSFSIHRKTSRSFTVSHRRLTLNIMVQPMILQQLLARGAEISRHSGFLARTLMACPESSMGTRYYKEPPTSLGSLKAFWQRITDCLNLSLVLDKDGCESIPTLKFSPAAKKVWTSFFNGVESGLKNPSKWLLIKDFASKSAENVARLAALLHLFEGKNGDISPATIENAIQIVEWHLWEARRLFGTKLLSSMEKDSVNLLQWIKDKKLRQTTLRHLQQFSPLRDRQKLDKAIEYLVETQQLSEKKLSSRTRLIIYSNSTNKK